MHIGSGADYEHLKLVGEAMVCTVERCDCQLRAISAGGGLSVQYQTAEPSVDTDHYFELWDEARRAIEARLGTRVSLEIEPGRFLVAAAGVLVAEVRAHKRVGDNYFVLVDAGFNELVRPPCTEASTRSPCSALMAECDTKKSDKRSSPGRSAKPATSSRRTPGR